MRDIGLDVHRDWRDVAIYENAPFRSGGRVSTAREQLALSLRPRSVGSALTA